ncbi:MAG: GTP cyclohydrolase I FolE2 [Bdellovibrionales bacterium]|nr:GTP cyclohydrolase I FolE2 [Bdellovibrionales bacterium]
MSIKNNQLDDVAVRPPERDLDLTLNAVGLENVQMQVLREGTRMPARGQAAVSLIDKQARGIHMSRLFRILTQFSERELSWEWLSNCLDQMLSTHSTLSDSGHMEVALDWPVLRQALLSQEHGWRTYPVSYRVSSHKGQKTLALTTRILYSSTCPCSASLSRQAMQDQFRQDFTANMVGREEMLQWLKENTVAAPHSQRSEATVTFTFDPALAPNSPIALIDVIEKALGTPVQAAVKREDEQEFARLNAQNLMFCEDAARKLKSALLKREELADFQIEVRHFESLHAHDVVARVGKF